ncbi:MAG TPA: sel1 repeat family protein [Gammaproteobacteria bacterium]|nr:sel1 repeat family protein [Gammaproteobacteria bacterium]
MDRWAKYTIFALTMTLASDVALAEVDYILEEKFHAELAKAEQGDSKAQYAVGEMYEKGRGVGRDPRKAFSWYSKSSQKGNMKAEYKLGLAYLNGTGIRRDYRKARDWLQKSSDKGYVRAQYYLGTLYEKGLGTEQDLDKALQWYKQALRGGYDPAAAGMQRVAQLQKRRQEKIARLRQEALETARKLQAKAAKPAPPAEPAPPPGTKQRILAGGWKRHDRAVEYLPSADTQCEDRGDHIECQSKTLTRNIGMADISFQTKSTLSRFKDDGSFKVAYRNNVLEVTITDEAFASSGAKVPVQTGWQETEHKLTCTFEDDTRLNCRKNKLRTIKLHR